jgi:tricorn protease
MDEPSGFTCIYVWSVADGQIHRVTDPMYDSSTPAWETEGNYLYFISTREYQPQVSGIEFNFATNRGRSLLALALRKDVKNPFPPQSDEVTIAKLGEDAADKSKPDDKAGDKEKADEKGKADEKKPEKKKEPIRIDFDGLQDRVSRVPVEAKQGVTDGMFTKPEAAFLRSELYRLRSVGHRGSGKLKSSSTTVS